MKQHRVHSPPIQIALCLAHHLSACMVVCLSLSVSLWMKVRLVSTQRVGGDLFKDFDVSNAIYANVLLFVSTFVCFLGGYICAFLPCICMHTSVITCTHLWLHAKIVFMCVCKHVSVVSSVSQSCELLLLQCCGPFQTHRMDGGSLWRS